MAKKQTFKRVTKSKADSQETNETKENKEKKRTASKKQEEKREENVKQPVSYIVWVLTFGAIGVLIFLSIIVDIVSRINGQDAILGKLTAPLMGLFGICTPVLGLYLLIYAYFCYKYRNDTSTKAAKGVLLILNVVFLLGAVHIISDFWANITPSITEFYKNGIDWKGCGIIGGYIGFFFGKLLHVSVGLVFSALAYLVCLSFFLGSSPLRVLRVVTKKIKCFGSYVFSKTKQSMEERAKEKEERKKEKEEDLQEQKKSSKDSEQKKTAQQAEKKTDLNDPKPVEQKTTDDNKVTEEQRNTSEQPQNKSEVPPVNQKSRTENYVTGSIYDAHIRNEVPKKEEGSEDNTAEDSDENKVKNKFGFRMGREARDDEGTPNEEASEDVSENTLEEESPTDEEKEIIYADDVEIPEYIYPPMDLLERGTEETIFNTAEVEQKKRILLATLEAFKVKADVVNISCGPTITRYEIEPEMGVSVKAIEKLGKDLALRLAAKSLRIEAPIPGKCAVGIEVSNTDRLTVKLRDILDSPVFRDHKSKLFCCLGVDVAGNAIYLDIPKMPHLLIAGATGMGKSVCLNCLIVSLLYRASPKDVRLILIDPKKVEFSHYADIPHLLAPVVTNIDKCAASLNWAVSEMERRYDIFEANSLRNLEEYQAHMAENPEAERLPSIVIVIDELADLMMQVGPEVENYICRLAQKARAAGMYLILGTQRPSVDVITGLIKANIPSRISLAVTSQVDSRTILDTVGAENLLDKGDILFAPAGARKALRVQGAFVSTKELNSICEFVRKNSVPQYDKNVVDNIDDMAKQSGKNKKSKSSDSSENDTTDTKDIELMVAALEVGFEQGTISTSYIQRRLSFGYSKAARVVDMLQQHGFVTPPDPTTKLRKIIISPQELAELKLNGTITSKKEETEE